MKIRIRFPKGGGILSDYFVRLSIKRKIVI